MPQYRHASGDVVTVSDTLAAYMDTRPGWQRELTEVERAALEQQAADERARIEQQVAELKGAALDSQLEQAGLPKTGLADEKRASLTEALAPPPPPAAPADSFENKEI